MLVEWASATILPQLLLLCTQLMLITSMHSQWRERATNREGWNHVWFGTQEQWGCIDAWKTDDTDYALWAITEGVFKEDQRGRKNWSKTEPIHTNKSDLVLSLVKEFQTTEWTSELAYWYNSSTIIFSTDEIPCLLLSVYINSHYPYRQCQQKKIKE